MGVISPSNFNLKTVVFIETVWRLSSRKILSSVSLLQFRQNVRENLKMFEYVTKFVFFACAFAKHEPFRVYFT